MDEIELPVFNAEGEYIDFRNAEWSYIFRKDNKIFIHCFLEKSLYFIVLSKELERWLRDSGIRLIEFGHVPYGGNIVTVKTFQKNIKIKLQLQTHPFCQNSCRLQQLEF